MVQVTDEGRGESARSAESPVPVQVLKEAGRNRERIRRRFLQSEKTADSSFSGAMTDPPERLKYLF